MCDFYRSGALMEQQTTATEDGRLRGFRPHSGAQDQLFIISTDGLSRKQSVMGFFFFFHRCLIVWTTLFGSQHGFESKKNAASNIKFVIAEQECNGKMK